MSTVYQYRIWCDTESTYVYSYGTSAPTTCPNNTAHTIDPSKTTAIQTITPETRNITQIVPGYYQRSTKPITVPVVTPGTVYSQTVSYPMDLNIWLIDLTTTTDMIGDSFSIIQAPETTIGYITAPVADTDTVLNVSSTAVSIDIVRGFELILDDGVTKTSLGLITAVDSTNSQLTVENVPGVAYAPGTLIKINAYMVKNLVVDSIRTFVFGNKGVATKLLPANTPFLFDYTNNTGSAKTLYFCMEYNYL